MPGKTFVFAVHALSYQKMLEKVEEGRMPNFEQLMEEGSYGVSKSVFSTSSAVDYISMVTGTAPGTHGIYDFQTNTIDESQLGSRPGKKALNSVDPGELEETRLFTSYDVRVPWVWDLMEDQRAVQMGLFSPATFPAPRLPNDGIWVSGYWNRPEPFLRENAAACNSPEVRKKLIEEYPDYPITPPMAIPPAYPEDAGDEIEYLSEKVEVDKQLSRKVQEARMRIMEDEDWDVFLTEEFFCDNIQHLTWPHSQGNALYNEEVEPELEEKDLLGEYFEHVDELLGEYMEKLDDETNVVVISAHGQEEAGERESMHGNFHKLIEYGIWQPPGGWEYREESELDLHNRARHSFNGSYIVAGPDFQDRGETDPISCMDFAPMMMALYGKEIPAHMDGRAPAHLIGVEDGDST